MDQGAFLKNTSLQLRNEYPYITTGSVVGVRKGDWIYLPFSGLGKHPERPELFNVKTDLPENVNLIQKYPERIKELQVLMEQYRSK